MGEVWTFAHFNRLQKTLFCLNIQLLCLTHIFHESMTNKRICFKVSRNLKTLRSHDEPLNLSKYIFILALSNWLDPSAGRGGCHQLLAINIPRWKEAFLLSHLTSTFNPYTVYLRVFNGNGTLFSCKIIRSVRIGGSYRYVVRRQFNKLLWIQLVIVV